MFVSSGARALELNFFFGRGEVVGKVQITKAPLPLSSLAQKSKNVFLLPAPKL